MSLKKAALILLLGAAVVPAIGQQAPSPGARDTGTPAPAGGPGTPARTVVDEQALRYFAAQGDTRRLETEIARLRALYPDWTPPADLLGPAQIDVELARMWQLFGEGKISDVRSAIAARQAADPRWVVPPDLIARIDEAEARRRLVNASDAGQWATVLRVATETPGLLVCANVDVLWRVADAFVKTGANDRARDAYAYVLARCTDANERLATMQKAMQVLDDAGLAELMKLEHRGPDGTGEFAALRDDMVRRRLGKAAEDPTLTVSPEDIATIEALARRDSQPGDALLLGWYLYRHNENARALDWFKIAFERNGGAKAAEGYVLALAAAKRPLEAEPIAYKWRESSPQNEKAYLDVVVSLLAADPPLRLAPDILTRFSAVVIKSRYASGAQALGWYAYNTGQLPAAANWFATALEWTPEDESAAYGLAVVRLRLRDTAGLNAIVRAWQGRSERIVALVSPEARRRLERQQPATGTVPLASAVVPGAVVAPAPAAIQPTRVAVAAPLPADAIVAPISPEERADYASGGGAAAALSGGRHGRCVAMTDAGFRAGRLSPGEAVARGWCLMELERPIEAAGAFDMALRTATGRTAEDAAYGKSLAYLRKGMTNAAAVAATEAPQDPRRQTQLNMDILAQQAVNAYRDQRYVEALIALDERNRLVPEQAGLMILRGWCYFQLNDMRSAERIFKALAASGNVEAQSGMNAILEKTRKIRT